MVHHSNVSLDYVENRYKDGAKMHVKDIETGEIVPLLPMMLRRWRSQGYAYVPPCDNVQPNGRCAGHEEEPNGY